MSNGVQDLRSLPLSDIIGAPVGAIVQAEAQAARTTLEFIEQVGFEKNPDAPAGASALDMGHLRMVEFTYQKPDAHGALSDFTVRVPLLALVPIPGVRIKTAKVSFTAKITDVYTETTETQETEDTSSGGKIALPAADPATPPATSKPAIFQQPALKLRGGFSSNSKSTDTTTGSYDLSVSLDIEHVGNSPGLEKLFNVLDAAIADMQR